MFCLSHLIKQANKQANEQAVCKVLALHNKAVKGGLPSQMPGQVGAEAMKYHISA